MQDAYVGDIGDYGKYGLLRLFRSTSLRLAVNWYKAVPAKNSKQADGRFTEYLSQPKDYRHYDPELFDELKRIVDENRKIEAVEAMGIGASYFYSEAVSRNRAEWHNKGLLTTKEADVVFLDPDNGLATENMMKKSTYSQKHVSWDELKDYYNRGQSVILYQHRPQMTKREAVIDSMTEYARSFLMADCLLGLEFPKFTNRYYFFFCHNEHTEEQTKIVKHMNDHWEGLCKQITFEK